MLLIIVQMKVIVWRTAGGWQGMFGLRNEVVFFSLLTFLFGLWNTMS
jgi:hypothetical protein